MGFEVGIASSEAKVRTAGIARDRADALPDAGAYIVLCPIAPPRLWSMVSAAVLSAMGQALATRAAPPDMMRRAFEAASGALERLRSRLVEPGLALDAQMGLFLAGQGAMSVALTRGIRVYRARGNVPERLFAQAQRPHGVSTGAPFMGSESVASGELLVVGTRDAFTVRSVSNLTSAPSKPTRPTMADLCEALLSPCRASGTGAASVMLRAG